MADLIARTFRVALDVTVSIRAIDEDLAQSTKRAFNNDALAAEPSTQEMLERDRRLLAALLADPEALRVELLRHVAWALDPVHPADEVGADLGVGQATDAQLIERLQARLRPEDVAEWRSLCDDDVFYDNTIFFQDAFTTTIGHAQLLAEEASSAPTDPAQPD